MARRKLNKNVVAGLTIFALIVVVAVSAIMLRQLQMRDPKHFVEQGAAYEESGDYAQAGLFYRKAWERSNNPAHLVSFGDMMIHQGEVRFAIEAYRHALVRFPDFVAAHRKLLEVLLAYAKPDGSVQEWTVVEEAAQNFVGIEDSKKTLDEQAMAHNAYGSALVHLSGIKVDNAAKGAEHLRKAADLAPSRAEYSIDLAILYAEQNRKLEAEDLFKSLVEKHSAPGPDAAKVRTALARQLGSTRPPQYETAEKLFAEALELAAQDTRALGETRIAFAGFLTQQWARMHREKSPEAESCYQRAEGILQKAAAADPEGFDANVQLATLYAAAQRTDDVLRVAEQRLSLPFSRKGITAARNRLQMFNLRILAADAAVAKALDAKGKPEGESWLSKADLHLTAARGEFPSHPRALSQSGRIKLARGQDRAALEDLRAADEAYKSFKTVDRQHKVTLARLHLKLNEPGAALNVVNDLLNQVGTRTLLDPTFGVLYGQVLLLNNMPDQALSVIEQTLQYDAQNSEALRVKAAIFERKGNYAAAAGLHELATGSSSIRALLEFRALEQSGEVERGIALLREAWKIEPGEPRIVTTLVLTLSGNDRLIEAADIVRGALGANPDEPVFRKLEVFTNASLTREQREEAIRTIIEAQADAYQRTVELAGFHFRRGEHAKATSLYLEAEKHLLEKQSPMAQATTSTQHRALLEQTLRAAMLAKDDAGMIAVKESAARHNVDGAGGRSLLGLYHMYRNESELAINALRQAVDLQPTDSESLSNLGASLHNLGRADDAKAFFERALEVNPDEAAAHRGLAAIAQARGDKEAYEKALAVCMRLIPSDPWVKAEKRAREEEKDPLAAITRREAELVKNPNDFDNMRQLARLAEGAKDRIRADKYHDVMLEKGGENESAAISASKYYRRSGRPQRALQIAESFAHRQNDAVKKANALLLVAGHHLNQGDMDQCEAVLQQAVAAAMTIEVAQSMAEFKMRAKDDPAEAIPWFEKAIDLARKSQSPLLSNLISGKIACALHRGLADLTRARQWIDEYKKEFPDELRWVYWESELHAQSGDVEKSVATLTEYLKIRPNDARVLLNRAKGYLSMGQFGLAVVDLEQIRRTDPLALELEPRILLARLRARSGRQDDVVRELEELVKDAPDSDMAAEQLIRAYLGSKQYALVERTAAGRINKSGADDPRWYIFRSLASLESGGTGAIADATRAMELAGTSIGPLIAASDIFVRANRFSEGADLLARKTEALAASPTLNSRLGLLLAKAGRTSEAVQRFRTAVTLAAAASHRVVQPMTEDLLKAFSIDEALRLFSIPPADPAANRANDRILIRLFRLAGKTQEAEKRLETALISATENSERAGLWYERAEMHQLLGNTDLARTAYEESVNYGPKNWVALNNLAYLLAEKLSDPLAALPYALRAVAVEDSADTLDTLGWIYVGLKNYPKAILELGRAVRYDPTSALILYHLGEAYRRAEQFLEAANVLQRASESAMAGTDEELKTAIQASQTETTKRSAAPPP